MKSAKKWTWWVGLSDQAATVLFSHGYRFIDLGKLAWNSPFLRRPTRKKVNLECNFHCLRFA